MNLKHLGDALDHFKGSLFTGLQRDRLLRRLAVDPMATDTSDWTPEDTRVYARLLGIQESQLVEHKHRLTGTRRMYIQETARYYGDLFLDPDTGIAAGKGKVKATHLHPEELLTLVETGESRVVAVYQHGSRCKSQDEVRKAVMRSLPQTWSCSYEATSVALLFFSLDEGRISAIHDHFAAALEGHAARRVRLWATATDSV